MITCNKCGAQLADDMKFCNQCGSTVETESVYETQEYMVNSDAPKGGSSSVKASLSGLLDTVASFIPPQLLKKDNKTMHLVGFASMAVLALVYLIGFFAFLSDICLPVGFSSEAAGGISGASSIWLLCFIVLMLAPVCVAAISVVNKKNKLWSVVASAVIIFVSFFTFIAWLICTPDSLIQAVTYYGGPNNMFAWYVMLDALSEVWYLKILLSAGVIIGYGVDYIANKNN